MDLWVSILALIAFVLFTIVSIGLIIPKPFLKFRPEEKRTRGALFLFYGVPLIVLFLVLGAIAPEPVDTPTAETVASETTPEAPVETVVAVETVAEVEEPTPEPEVVEEQKPTLDITLDEFVTRYNQSFDNLGLPDINVNIKDEGDGFDGSFITAQLESNTPFIAMVVTADKQSRKVQSIIYMTGMHEDEAAIMGALLGYTAVIMAIEDPKMTESEREKYIADLKVENVSLDNSQKASINGLEYNTSLSEYAGLMLTVDIAE